MNASNVNACFAALRVIGRKHGWSVANNSAFAKAAGALFELQDGLVTGCESLSWRLLALERGLRLQRCLETQFGIQHFGMLQAMVRVAAGTGASRMKRFFA